ncbi:MAG: FTR1 family iron permease [Desmonostoc vinosum HA7617-LM4]|jgi:high-affinity iron transporter|nr:FTR1 family iron permease [Desmonostoc vinosum HA7617-LM4]
MDFSTAIPTFVITLREGVEAALVVGIVLALLKKAKQSRLNSWVYAGVVVGIIASAIIGVLFGWVTQALGKAYPQYIGVIEPALEGAFSVLAIAMLSWMLIWMTTQAKFMKAQVEGAVTSALSQKAYAGWGIFSLVFIAVVREGFETVLFIAGSFQQGLIPTFGAFAGLTVAVIIGVLLFKWGVKINIRLFFQAMGILLVLIVAGLVVTALQRFDEAIASVALSSRASQSLCFYYERFTRVHSCILGPMVWNTSQILPDEKFPGIIFKSLFGYREHLYIVQAVGYVVFLFTVGGLYFRSLSASSPQGKKKISASQKPISSAKNYK